MEAAELQTAIVRLELVRDELLKLEENGSDYTTAGLRVELFIRAEQLTKIIQELKTNG